MDTSTHERIKRSISINDSTGCWEWMKARSVTGGYGVISVSNKQQKVHRAMWMATFGAIPEGMCVLHRCDNPPCCNPNHLFLGTVGDNNQDRNNKGRQATGKAITRNRRSFKGKNNPRAKLNDEKAHYIRSRYSAGGVRLKDLAVELDVSIQSIWKIVKGKRYVEVSDG